MQLFKTFVCSLLCLIVVISSGCVSSYVLQNTKKQVALNKAIVSQNDVAIKAIRLGADGVGLGIDVTNLDAIKARPLAQLGAAIADVVILYGAYEGVRWIDEQSNGSSDDDKGIEILIDDSDDTLINIGDDNEIDDIKTDR